MVASHGYWGDTVLKASDMLFLDAAIVRPAEVAAHDLAIAPKRAPPLTHAVELSNVELYHRRLGHPGRKATQQLARWGLIPNSAARPLPTPCITCVAAKSTDVRRLPKREPAGRVLERVHVDLLGRIHPEGYDESVYALTLVMSTADTWKPPAYQG